MPQEAIHNTIPLLSVAAPTIPPPMLPLIAFLALSAGAVADSPFLLANGQSILSQIGLGEIEQMGVRTLLAIALCYVFKLLLSYHKDAVRRLDDEKRQLRQERDQLIERIRKMNEDRDARLKQLEDK